VIFGLLKPDGYWDGPTEIVYLQHMVGSDVCACVKTQCNVWLDFCCTF